MWGMIICGLLLLIFAPGLLALIGAAAIPVIIIMAIGMIGAYIYVFSGSLKENKLYKQNMKEYRAKCEEVKKEMADKPLWELEELLFDNYEKLNSSSESIPSKYKFGTIEYEERKHDRRMRIGVILQACGDLYFERKCEEVKKEYSNKPLHELKSLKAEEIRNYEHYQDTSTDYKLAHIHSSYAINSYKRTLENKIKVKALTEIIEQ